MPMTADEKAIRDVIAEWVRAAEAADYPAVLSLIAEDGVMLIAGLPAFRSRKEYADFIAKAARPGRTFRVNIDIHEIAVHGDWAHVWAREKSDVTLADGSPPLHASGDSLNVLRREPDGKWVVAVAANMMTMEGRR